jgi:hypothetical protein
MSVHLRGPLPTPRHRRRAKLWRSCARLPFASCDRLEQARKWETVRSIAARSSGPCLPIWRQTAWSPDCVVAGQVVGSTEYGRSTWRCRDPGSANGCTDGVVPPTRLGGTAHQRTRTCPGSRSWLETLQSGSHRCEPRRSWRHSFGTKCSIGRLMIRSSSAWVWPSGASPDAVVSTRGPGARPRGNLDLRPLAKLEGEQGRIPAYQREADWKP